MTLLFKIRGGEIHMTTETVTVYKGEEVVIIDQADLEAFKANGYEIEAPAAKPPVKPATPPAK